MKEAQREREKHANEILKLKKQIKEQTTKKIDDDTKIKADDSYPVCKKSEIDIKTTTSEDVIHADEPGKPSRVIMVFNNIPDNILNSFCSNYATQQVVKTF